MLHAIDYDGTFSRDPDYYRAVVAIGRLRGHEYVMVTGRSDSGRWGREVRDDVGDLMPIVFADNGWKKAAALRAGYEVDVWIDDKPEWIARQDPAAAEKREKQTREALGLPK